MDNGIAVVGVGGRIGNLLLYELSRIGIPVTVGSEIRNLDNRDTIDALVKRMGSEDKAHGRLPWEISKKNNDTLGIRLNGFNYDMKIITTDGVPDINWKKEGIMFVEEATGRCLTRYTKDAKPGNYGADLHFGNVADTILVSAPTKDEDSNLVLGVNEGTYNPKKDKFNSNLSCTTKAIAFFLKVMYDNGVNTPGTIIVSVPHSETGPELRRLLSDDYDTRESMMREETSGAQASLSKIFNVDGGHPRIHKVEVVADRAPVLDGSYAIIQFDVDNPKHTADEIKKMFRDAVKDQRYYGGVGIYENGSFFNTHLLSSPSGIYPIDANVPSAVVLLDRLYNIGVGNARSAKVAFSNERAPARNQAMLTQSMLDAMAANR